MVFQDVSLYFKLVLDDLPCPLLDSSFRYLQSDSCFPELYSLAYTYKLGFFVTMPMGVYNLSFLFCNFVLAAALFYLAELVEEYTVLTAKVIQGMLAVSSSAFGLVICVVTVSIIVDD